MFSILIVIIYLAFISLGLPDSLLGSAWPMLHKSLNVPLSYAGIISMIITGNTILSSLNSDRITKKFGAGIVTSFSVLLTAVSLYGFSVANSFIVFCFLSIPYGLGAGAIDATLNNYVALHYKSKHMSWLHCFWGIGASISPYIMSYCIVGGYGWEKGYSFVSIIQISITFILFLSLPLWKKSKLKEKDIEHKQPLPIKNILNIKGVPFALFAFFAYCALEFTTGLWATSYLIEVKNIDIKIATKFAALFYWGLALGRFLCGFIADKFKDISLIRFGSSGIILGIILLLLPTSWESLPLLGLILIGFGCAPVFPALIHSTPANFGKENSQAIIGLQMASAYTGAAIAPPIFGFLTSFIGFNVYPFYLFIFATLIIVMLEILNKKLLHK